MELKFCARATFINFKIYHRIIKKLIIAGNTLEVDNMVINIIMPLELYSSTSTSC